MLEASDQLSGKQLWLEASHQLSGKQLWWQKMIKNLGASSFWSVSASCCLISFWKVLHRSSLVFEVSEWSFDWIWSSHWHGSAAFSSSQWILLSMDSMVFCSTLISMVRSELFHSVTFYHGLWWSFWSISSWELILVAADSDTRSSAESGGGHSIRAFLFFVYCIYFWFWWICSRW